MVKLLIAVSQCVNKQMEYNKAENSKRKSAGVDAITFFFFKCLGVGDNFSPQFYLVFCKE